MDVGLFRIGGEEYAENGGGLGLATIRREHVTIRDGVAVFDYPAKAGVRRVHAIDDPLCLGLVRTLKRRRGGEPQLLAFRDGRRWVNVTSDEVNGYLKQQIGEEFSAKDFRTWNATVIAAVALAAAGRDATTKTARQRVIKQTVGRVAEVLGNTPAVARRAYIDPRILTTIDGPPARFAGCPSSGGARSARKRYEREFLARRPIRSRRFPPHTCTMRHTPRSRARPAGDDPPLLDGRSAGVLRFERWRCG